MDVKLHRYQEFLEQTYLIVLDEISMVGRQMMGRIDSRFRQGRAGRSDAEGNLGGMSCVCVGDPAQCESILDQQIYDCTAHKDTAEGTAAAVDPEVPPGLRRHLPRSSLSHPAT